LDQIHIAEKGPDIQIVDMKMVNNFIARCKSILPQFVLVVSFGLGFDTLAHH